MIGLGLPFEDYLDLDAVNWSSLKRMEISPRHYRAYLSQGIKDTPSLRLGRIAHMAILEPDRFEREVVVWDRIRRGKDWDVFSGLNADKQIASPAEYQRAIALRDAVHGHPVAAHHVGSALHTELTLTWTDGETGLLCKARPDLVTDDTLIDIKTTKDIGEHFGKAAGRLRYHAQLAWYYDALAELDNEPRRVVIIAIEKEAPHDVVCYVVPPDLLDIGRRHYRMLLNRLAECKQRDEWPGIAPGEIELMIPDYALTSPLDEYVPITIGGTTLAL